MSKWRPSAKMCHLVSKWCPSANMYDVLPLFWFRSGASVRRCTICCRCCGLEVVPQCRKIRYVAVALVSKWCPDTKKYDLLPLLWSRSSAPVVRWTICCRCFGLQLEPPSAKKQDLMLLLWSRSGAPMLKKCDLLPLRWPRSGASLLSSAIFCRWFGLEVMPQC